MSGPHSGNLFLKSKLAKKYTLKNMMLVGSTKTDVLVLYKTSLLVLIAMSLTLIRVSRNQKHLA